MSAHHLIVIGFDEIVANKYLPCIRDAIRSGHITSYSIIDLESQRKEIDRRISTASVKPRGVAYLPDSGDRAQETPRELIEAAIGRLRVPGVPTKVYIATEVRAHEAYLRSAWRTTSPRWSRSPYWLPSPTGGSSRRTSRRPWRSS